MPAAWDRPEVVGVYEDWRRITDSYDGDRVMVGEVFLLDAARVQRYVAPGRLHTAFDFTVMRQPFEAAALRTTAQTALAAFATPTWVLSNHDLVRHATRYGGGDLGRRRGLAVTALLLALPGSTYLYQGEELGLDETDVPDALRQDPVYLRTGGAVGGRDGCRTPVPWTAEAPGFGFTTGDPWLPMPPESPTHNAQVQAGDPASVLAGGTTTKPSASAAACTSSGTSSAVLSSTSRTPGTGTSTASAAELSTHTSGPRRSASTSGGASSHSTCAGSAPRSARRRASSRR